MGTRRWGGHWLCGDESPIELSPKSMMLIAEQQDVAWGGHGCCVWFPSVASDYSDLRFTAISLVIVEPESGVTSVVVVNETSKEGGVSASIDLIEYVISVYHIFSNLFFILNEKSWKYPKKCDWILVWSKGLYRCFGTNKGPVWRINNLLTMIMFSFIYNHFKIKIILFSSLYNKPLITTEGAGISHLLVKQSTYWICIS